MSNWSRATIRQYNSALKKWAAFCKNIGIDRLHPRVEDILNFLGQLFESGASFSSISTHKSAIIVYLSAINGEFCRKDTTLPNATLDLKQLTQKTIVLLALVAPKRVSELAALSKPGRGFLGFSLDFMNKNRGFGKAHTAVVQAYEDDILLCLLMTIKDYINRIILYRNQVRTLFVSVNRPHRS
ncbi:hypothetical protein COOONC_20510, partial [Cooperia oncophora]